MRIYHRIALVLLLIFVFEDNVLGAPTKGRYMWVKCNPNDKDANCVQQQGPWIDLKGASQRLPPSAIKDIVSVENGEDAPETETEEQSGESSGDMELLGNPTDKKQGWMDDGPGIAAPQVEEPFLEEDASGEADYYNEPKLSPEDLKEDNVIQ